MTVKGVVTGIVFRNEENGYTVLNIETESGGEVVCVGCLPSFTPGEVLTLTGTTSVHKVYGEQLNVESFVAGKPTTKDGIVKYLSSGLIKGVGEVTASNIYKAFGGDTLGVIESNPMLLTSVKGISQQKAIDISNAVSSLKNMQEQIMFLQNYGITVNTAVKIYNVYKADTKNTVKENTYKLIDDIDGIGFLTADKIALSLGYERESEFRVRAAIVYCLKDAADKQGNTFLTLDELFLRCSELLSLELKNYERLTEDTLTKLVLEPTVKLFDLNGARCAALISYYKLEHAIAARLLTIDRDAKRIMTDADSLITQFERVNKLEFHKGQLAAVKSAVVNGVTVITGGPGTGKTTIIKCIADILASHSLRVEFAAPTGRAAKRMSQSTNREAKTIHRLLGYEFSGGKMSFKFNRYNTLPCDAVIVDELSMVDVNLMYSLLSAIENGTRLILVGDKDQLPSVGAGNILADIIASGVFEIRYLTYVYRQSEDSLIVSNAHLINKCQMPVIDNTSKDFFVMNTDDLNVAADTVVQLVKTRLPKFTNVPSTEIQVLGALKSGVAGVENLNLRLQEALNPYASYKSEIKSGKNIIRTGDRVMQTVNNYELTFTRQNADGSVERGEGVFNGDIGFVKNIDKANGLVEVLFDDNRLAEYGEQEIFDLQLAYAVTVHKSQGCEFDVVVVPLVNGPPTIINKNLLYTAITRAKKLVVLVGSKKILGMMIHNNYVAARTTNLRRFLKEEQEAARKFFG